MKNKIVQRIIAVALVGVLSVSLAVANGAPVFAENLEPDAVEGNILAEDAVNSGSKDILENDNSNDEGVTEEEPEQTTDDAQEPSEEIGDGIEGTETPEEDAEEPAPSVKDGWIHTEDGWYLYKAGVMLTGWQWVGGNCYYMYENGIMAADTWIGDWYVDASGAWIPSYQPPHWILSSAGWWYRNADGSYPANAWQMIDNQWYYFNSAGYMVTGWQLINGSWYYLSGSGAMLTGWQWIGGSWYYLLESGSMATGWQLIGDTWYYLNGSGAMATGWLLLGNIWYYLDASGAMQTGKQEIGKQVYFLKDSGAMVTGWNLEDEVWYYYNASGAMQTGWILVGATWYYCEPKTGAMQTGWLTVNKVQYYLDESGAMRTGWYEIESETGKNWYYFDASGAMLKARWVGNYYVLSDGKMAVNQYIGDYYVGEDGKWVQTTGDNKVYVVELEDGKTTTVIGQYDEAASQEVFTLLNKYRLENECDPLNRINTALQTAAETRGYELAKSNNHTRPNGEAYTSIYAGVSGETIAGATGMTAEGAMAVWKASEPDKLYMLNKTATSVGIAAFKATNNVTYYVMLFA